MSRAGEGKECNNMHRRWDKAVQAPVLGLITGALMLSASRCRECSCSWMYGTKNRKCPEGRNYVPRCPILQKSSPALTRKIRWPWPLSTRAASGFRAAAEPGDGQYAVRENAGEREQSGKHVQRDKHGGPVAPLPARLETSVSAMLPSLPCKGLCFAPVTAS